MLSKTTSCLNPTADVRAIMTLKMTNAEKIIKLSLNPTADVRAIMTEEN